jgi:hypothetical protein
MSFLIRSEVDSKIARPGETIRWTIEVASESGAAGNDLQLSVCATGKVKPRQRRLETDSEGKALVELTASQTWEQAEIEVRHGHSRWEGRMYVTDVEITLPEGLVLLEGDEDLLRMLFWDKAEVHIIRQFGSGQSGNRVFQVKAFDDQGAFLTQVAKVGIRDEILQEGKNYELFRNRLASAAAISGVAECGVQAAIIYGDASAAAALAPVIPLAEYFLSADNGHPELESMLYSILGVGLRSVHGSFQVKNLSPRQVVGKWLPENLVVSLGSELPCAGVFPMDQARLCPAGALELTPRGLEHRAGNHNDLKPGDVVLLRGFRVGKLQTADLNLEDENAKRHRVKVRFDGAIVAGIACGQIVDVIARVVTDRTTRLAFAVHHCLEAHGFQSRPNRQYCLNRENYPDPVELLPAILDSRQDIAWATIHGDLHWENVMAEGPANWWLIDYGLTKKGAVLYDYVKLETYLRMTVIAVDQSITPDEALAFERDLLDNPFGDLPSKRSNREILNKAATAIRSIRRLARPYMLDGYTGYRDLFFCYAMAVVKYYPTEDRWSEKAADMKKAEMLRSSSRRSFFVLAAALCLARGIESERVLRKFPDLRLSFVPMGSVLQPKEGQIVLDVGNCLEPCMIDHHHIKDGEPRSTAGLVWTRPELILGCPAARSPDDVTWITHEHPDFDAVSSLFLAWHLAKCGFFPPGADQLQKYALLVDMGDDLVEQSAFPARTPYALFMATVGSVPEIKHSDADHKERVRRTWRVITFLCQSEANGLHPAAFVRWNRYRSGLCASGSSGCYSPS